MTSFPHHFREYSLLFPSSELFEIQFVEYKYILVLGKETTYPPGSNHISHRQGNETPWTEKCRLVGDMLDPWRIAKKILPRKLAYEYRTK